MTVIVLAALAVAGLALAYVTGDRAYAWVALVLALAGAGAAARLLLVGAREQEAEREPVDESEPEAGPVPDEAPGTTVPAAGVSTEVVVIPGRRRFHRDDCALLADNPTERITEEEARDEGFTPCSRCWE